jgi:hypothetical protein
MNKSIWRKTLITDVLLSFGLCFGIISPVLILRGIDRSYVLIVVTLVISLVMFIIGIPVYLHVFKSEWNRNNRE